MTVSVGGVGDRATAAIEGHDERVRQAYIDAVPPCPECGVKLTIKSAWKGKKPPSASCQNVECPKPGSWTPERLALLMKGEV